MICYCNFAKYEFRKDKYGQSHRLVCLRCKRASNWHTSQERARTGFNQTFELINRNTGII